MYALDNGYTEIFKLILETKGLDLSAKYAYLPFFLFAPIIQYFQVIFEIILIPSNNSNDGMQEKANRISQITP